MLVFIANNDEWMEKSKTRHTKKHPGFDRVSSRIAQEKNISKDRADAILASSTRRASASARRKNPRLKNVEKSLNKSVTLGHAYNQPLPMPMRADGMPDWDSPQPGLFVSFALERGPLKGKVVILKRLANGMYVIAEDKFRSKDDANRDKDKGKLRKEESHWPDHTDPEEELETEDNYGTTAKSFRKAEFIKRKEHENPKGGLNAAGRAAAKRAGHNLKPPVKRAHNLAEMKRQYSFLSRMSGNPGPERDKDGKPTRLLLSLQVWGASSKADAKRKAASLKRRIESMEKKNG